MYYQLQLVIHDNTYHNTCHNTYTNTERWYWYVFNTYQYVLMRIWYVFINVFSMYCKLQISLHANTYYNTCHKTYTNTERWYWYVFNTYQHVLVCILACILPVSCICCSDTYQYGLEYVTRYWLRYIPIRSTLHANTDHYAPIQTTTCQYRPLRAYYTLEYMLSTCQTAPSPPYEPPLSVGRTTHPTIHRIRATDCRSRGGKVRQASIKRAPCIGNAFIIALH